MAKDNWSAKTYNTNASFVYSKKFTNAVVSLLDPQPGETVFDLGCGSGELTLELSEAVQPGGKVVGADNSVKLLSKARTNDVRGEVDWLELDGHDVEANHEASYDAAFTNAALHWMKADPAKVARGVYKVLKKGGRYAGEMGGFLNMVGVRAALHHVLKVRGIDPEPLDPYYFPTVEEYKAVLEEAGFRVESIELVPRITPLPESGLKGWLETFAFAFLDALPSEEEKEKAKDEIVDLLKVDMKHSHGFTVMYVRLRFLAYK